MEALRRSANSSKLALTMLNDSAQREKIENVLKSQAGTTSFSGMFCNLDGSVQVNMYKHSKYLASAVSLSFGSFRICVSNHPLTSSAIQINLQTMEVFFLASRLQPVPDTVLRMDDFHDVFTRTSKAVDTPFCSIVERADYRTWLQINQDQVNLHEMFPSPSLSCFS